RTTNAQKAAPTDTGVAEPEAAPAAPAADPALVSAAPTTVPLTLDHNQVVETIRKNVKRLGKEATFCRFTQEEKHALRDIIYTYKRAGIRTSENEVIRIAVNWLLENYQRDGQNSVLAQVIDKLNA